MLGDGLGMCPIAVLADCARAQLRGAIRVAIDDELVADAYFDVRWRRPNEISTRAFDSEDQHALEPDGGLPKCLSPDPVAFLHAKARDPVLIAQVEQASVVPGVQAGKTIDRPANHPADLPVDQLAGTKGPEKKNSA